jgi:predicted O-linked N-acetylglucosamine transferase (SPINDLY family)
VAASLLNAVGLPELVTSTQAEYEERAVQLATDPSRLQGIRKKLADNRLSTALFDTQLFARHIESAYLQMYERYQADLPPGDIYVRP